jgi:hypothetical protein
VVAPLAYPMVGAVDDRLDGMLGRHCPVRYEVKAFCCRADIGFLQQSILRRRRDLRRLLLSLVKLSAKKGDCESQGARAQGQMR